MASSDKLPQRFRYKTLDAAPWKYGFVEHHDDEVLVIAREFSPRWIPMPELTDLTSSLCSFQWIDNKYGWPGDVMPRVIRDMKPRVIKFSPEELAEMADAEELEKLRAERDQAQPHACIGDALQAAIERSGLDVSLCMTCGEPVVCLPDGVQMCESCWRKENA